MTRKPSSKASPQHRSSKTWSLNADDALPSPQASDAVKDAAVTKGILVRTPIATWRRLKHISADHNKSLQALLLEAIENVIKVYKGDKK